MLIGAALAAIIIVHAGAAAPVICTLMSVFVVSAEVLGRWVFYRFEAVNHFLVDIISRFVEHYRQSLQ